MTTALTDYTRRLTEMLRAQHALVREIRTPLDVETACEAMAVTMAAAWVEYARDALASGEFANRRERVLLFIDHARTVVASASPDVAWDAIFGRELGEELKREIRG